MFGRTIADTAPEILDVMARNEWRAAYDTFVHLTNIEGKLVWPEGLFDRVIAIETSGFAPSTASPDQLDAYAKLIAPVYRLPTFSALRRKAEKMLKDRYARPAFKRVVQPVSRFNPNHWEGPYLHGTRALTEIVAEGVCARSIDQLVDSDPIGGSPPERWWARWGWGGNPPMSAVSKAQNRGYDFGYSWLGFWRERVFDWYKDLNADDKLLVAQALGYDQAFPLKTVDQRDMAADLLGSLTLFFVTERPRVAESYGHSGGVLEVDPRYAQALDIIEDDLQGEDSYAIIIPPGICPQIDWRGLRYKGTPLGGIW